MTAKFQDGKLQLDFHDLLSSVPDEQKVELLESLSCDKAILKHVTAQLLDGFTENTYCGAYTSLASAEPHTTLDKARREIALRASEQAEKTIKALTQRVADLERRESKLRSGLIALRSFVTTSPFYTMKGVFDHINSLLDPA